MIKRIVLVRRLPALTREEFAEHWISRHAIVARRLPGLRRYVVNVLQGADSASGWDGVGELWFDDRAQMAAAFEALGPEIAADLRHFVLATEHLIVDEHEIALPSA